MSTTSSTKINTRLYINAPLPGNGSIVLDKDQSHYLANVMRVKIGTPVALFNGSDGEWACEIDVIEKRAVTLKVTTQTRAQTPEPDVWLVFAPIKKARIDFMAQKATELGASHLLPIYTRRTIVDRVKIDRLHANAAEAAEQCERVTVPTIGEPVKFTQLMKNWPEERHIMFCDETLSGEAAHEALKKLSAPPKKPWAIFIGPEGGFDDSERDLLKAHPSTVAVSLGPRVLRADTAAMAALSLWQSTLGDW
jgi:16S rRNA (uracil1498-N3)-methyltransferase